MGITREGTLDLDHERMTVCGIPGRRNSSKTAKAKRVLQWFQKAE